MKMLITIMLFSLGSAVHAQLPKLYAFTQRVSGGANVGEATMDGNTTVKKKNDGIRQLIYLSLAPGTAEVTVTELWIKGKQYAFTIAEPKGPIMDETGIKMPSEKRKLLVPAGTRIIQILPGQEITGKTTRKSAQENEVFVCYRVANKTHSIASKQLEPLQDLLME